MLRKRKRWAQKEAELRNIAKEEEKRKADLQEAKGKGKATAQGNSKVNQVSLNKLTNIHIPHLSWNDLTSTRYSVAQQLVVC